MPGMARRLRLQFPGALYHVINRGNYRRDLFESPGAANAFVSVLDEACRRFTWQLHAYVLMRNHYHLAVETPESNLVDGMHWLQTTYCSRFNRLRTEHGHVFQGRYQALLIEDAAALARVVNYIHLNPVRSKLVPTEQVRAFRWSSFRRLTNGRRDPWLTAAPWLGALGFPDNAEGWRAYERALLVRASIVNADEDEEFCRGWAIGTHGWRQRIAADYAHLALGQGIGAEELRELKHARWAEALERALSETGKTRKDVTNDRKTTEWKIRIAARLRSEVAASYAWLAAELNMGRPGTARSLVYRLGKQRNSQYTA